MADDKEIEETFEEPTTKLPITVSLEPCKKKFFDGDMEAFTTEVKSGKFKVYSGEYVDAADYEGRPEFIVKNLVNGFSHQLESKRKYLFTAFKCTKTDGKYNISAVWICNCTLPMDQVVPEMHTYFTWEELDIKNETHFDKLSSTFVKNDNQENVVIVSYCH
ncbi:putative ORFan [Tupanvirus deep ocean]|uniref:ORFan n=2 Tax=Tupanvirus TaxID=2094720 RepID=A0AC62A788_9VIRU|nr:putative ORFan [Tupanvirus deep ocean]QKU33646.1 putative ORFan [Tupanvirus deep ocean]